MISINDSEVFGGQVAKAIRNRLEQHIPHMTELLGELVSIESGSDDAGGLAAMACRLEALMGEFGPVVRHRSCVSGVDHLIVSVDGRDADLPHALVLGHFDTVWPSGTIDRIPFGVSDQGAVTGPGCFDMKGGL